MNDMVLETPYEMALGVAERFRALRKAKKLAGKNGIVICVGSVYLAGDVINLIEGN